MNEIHNSQTRNPKILRFQKAHKFWRLFQFPTIYMILKELKLMMVKNFRHSLLSTFPNLFNAKF